MHYFYIVSRKLGQNKFVLFSRLRLRVSTHAQCIKVCAYCSKKNAISIYVAYLHAVFALAVHSFLNSMKRNKVGSDQELLIHVRK